jgi:cell wall-associated NlpC family hydrolase
MYAWAGGNAYGPTYGVCAGDGAFNDCHIQGFDCSGLTLYGWAPFTSLAHYTVTQYGQGSYHPGTGDLRPGDLVFWSSNGSVSGIHHVAMYIGGGNVIQAPQSGSPIQITPLWDVDWGYYGATRPLT